MNKYEKPASFRFLSAVSLMTLHCVVGIAGGGGILQVRSILCRQ